MTIQERRRQLQIRIARAQSTIHQSQLRQNELNNHIDRANNQIEMLRRDRERRMTRVEARISEN